MSNKLDKSSTRIGGDNVVTLVDDKPSLETLLATELAKRRLMIIGQQSKVPLKK